MDSIEKPYQPSKAHMIAEATGALTVGEFAYLQGIGDTAPADMEDPEQASLTRRIAVAHAYHDLKQAQGDYADAQRVRLELSEAANRL